MDRPEDKTEGAEPLIVHAVHSKTGEADPVVVPASDAPEDVAEAKEAEKTVARKAAEIPPPTKVEAKPAVTMAQAPGPGVPIDSPVVHVEDMKSTAAPVVAGTALRSDPATDHVQQAELLKQTDRKTISAEIEKAKAEDREIHGHEPGGTLVTGMEDDQLWALLRRFDQQINHVLQPARSTPPNQPDLRMTNLPDVPFRSDTLKSNFERVFAAIGPPSTRGIREFMRITDWEKETYRTGAYCIAYFTAWAFQWTTFALLTFFAVLVCFPGTRRYLFPPPKPPLGTPPSATDPKGEKGDESLIGTTEGIKHRSKTEQAEEQAFEARAVFEAYTRAVLIGHRGRKGNAKVGAKDLDPDEEDDDAEIKDEYGDVIGERETAVSPQSKGEADAEIGGQRVKAHDEKNKEKVLKMETKRKRDEKVNKAAKMTETGLGSVADTMEILQHAMSPPVPYPDYHARFKIAAAFLIVPAFLIQFTPGWVWCRLFGFSIGAALWGHHLAIRAAKEFIRLVPNWQELLDLRNSLLSNTPTNAQLILHILRVSEDIGHPIPPAPPPPLQGTPKEALKDTSPAVDPDAESFKHGEGNHTAKKAAAKTKGHIANTFKKFSRKLAGFRGDVAVDGSQKRLGNKYQTMILNQKFGDESPDAFACKLDKNTGHVIIDENEMRVAWVPASSKAAQHVWDIEDIMELQKEHISVPRMALGWIGGADVESLGLSIRFADSLQQEVEKQGDQPDDETYHFTSVRRREALFNRLIAIGSQRWEIL